MIKLFNQSTSFILASASPRRKSLLANLGLDFQILPADIDEQVLVGESPGVYVKRLAREKALKIAQTHPDRFVLGCDTSVVFEGQIFGKPSDAQDAREMLARLSGQEHQVFGAFCLVNLKDKLDICELDITKVKFIELSSDLIQAYVASGEPLDKAGAYGIQELGAGLVESVVGSYTNVVGLNLAKVVKILRKVKVIG